MDLSQAFEQVVKERRSVRHFTGEPVDEKVIVKAVELAHLAPSSGNYQPWTYYWVRQPKEKKEIFEAFLKQEPVATASDLLIVVGDFNIWPERKDKLISLYKTKFGEQLPSFLQRYYRVVPKVFFDYGPFFIKAYIKKFLFLFLRFRKPLCEEPLTKQELKAWAYKNVALSCQSFMLAIKSLGCDSCPLEGFDQRIVKKILSLKSSQFVAMGIVVGHADKKIMGTPQVRFPINEVLRRYDG